MELRLGRLLRYSKLMIDFLCIGAQKAGTTWLMANLSRHPEVWTPPFIKELHYFDAIHLGYAQSHVLQTYLKRGQKFAADSLEKRAYIDKLLDPSFTFTDDWYRHIFSIAPRDSKVGECTPLYGALNDEGVQHVARLVPEVRLIYIIRDPFDRTLSSFRMAMDRRGTSNGDDVAGLLDQELFMKRGDYRGNITRWETYFDRAQILYVPFGHLRTDPKAVMRQVEGHLGISAFRGYPQLSDSVHRTKKEGKTIRPELLDRIKRLVDPQYSFLAERFGEPFVASIK